MVQKAALSNADAVCLDLEDGVPADRKSSARESLKLTTTILTDQEKLCLIRINSELEQVSFDLSQLPRRCAAVVLPKAQSMQHIESLADSLDRLFGVDSNSDSYEGPGIIAMFESAAGILKLAQDSGNRAHKRLLALSVGTEDLAADLCCEPGSGLVMHAFDQISLCCARLGVDLLGFPDSISELRDLDLFKSGVQKGARSGAVGAFCIHPAQVSILNHVFQANDKTVDWANQVINAYEKAGKGGAISVNGKMIDPPVYIRAKRIISRVR